MKPSWMSDARQIPDEVMTFIRQIAVRAINEKKFHPDDVSEMLGISNSSIYDWLHRFTINGALIITSASRARSAQRTQRQGRDL